MEEEQLSELEDQMARQIHVAGLPDPILEHRFAPPRRWRFDLAWPSDKVALEIEGGTWINGRHSRGAAFEKDCEKYNTAVLLGWQVFRATNHMVLDGRALALLQDLFA